MSSETTQGTGTCQPALRASITCNSPTRTEVPPAGALSTALEANNRPESCTRPAHHRNCLTNDTQRTETKPANLAAQAAASLGSSVLTRRLFQHTEFSERVRISNEQLENHCPVLPGICG